MGEQPRKSGTAGGIAGKPGYTRVPDPVDGLSYHRTLMRLPGQDPVTAYPIASFAGENINSFVCYTKSNQNFADYATPWERSLSGRTFKVGPGDPVVDQDLAVVGHFGWFQGDKIWLPKSTPRVVGNGELAMSLKMQDLVESGVPLVISLAEPPGYERFRTCEQNYQLRFRPGHRARHRVWRARPPISHIANPKTFSSVGANFLP